MLVAVFRKVSIYGLPIQEILKRYGYRQMYMGFLSGSRRVVNGKDLILVFSTLALVLSGFSTATAAQSTLKGGVRLNNSAMRLERPVQSRSVSPENATSDAIPVAPSRFSGRATAAGASGGLVDPKLFAATPARDNVPLSGQAENRRFDIGAERGSKALTLAWEAWHKQLCAEIYARWQEVALIRGEATMKVTVTRDRHVMAEITRSSGKTSFDRILVRVINSLEGNPGLSFPAGSQRREVSFEADYVADTNVRGGYSWTKNDYETVRVDH